ERNGARWLALALALTALGSLVDWTMPLFLVVLGVDAARRWRRGGGMRFLAASVGACLLALMLAPAGAARVSGPVGTHELATALAFRLELHGQYTRWQLAGKVIDYSRRYFTEPVLAASLATAWMTARCAWQQGRLSARARLLVLFGVVGIVPVLGFPSSARYHAYWQFYLLPYATLSLAYVLERLAPRLSPGALPPSPSAPLTRRLYRPRSGRLTEICGLPTGRPAALQPFRPSTMALTSV